MRLSRADDSVVDVEDAGASAASSKKKFRQQMVLLQRKVAPTSGDNIPHLLEIHSNCKWDGKR